MSVSLLHRVVSWQNFTSYKSFLFTWVSFWTTLQYGICGWDRGIILRISAN